jgi:hypothetical protein
MVSQFLLCIEFPGTAAAFKGHGDDHTAEISRQQMRYAFSQADLREHNFF